MSQGSVFLLRGVLRATLLIILADHVFYSATTLLVSIKMNFQGNALISAPLEPMGIIQIWILNNASHLVHLPGIKIILPGPVWKNALLFLPTMLIRLLENV